MSAGAEQTALWMRLARAWSPPLDSNNRRAWARLAASWSSPRRRRAPSPGAAYDSAHEQTTWMRLARTWSPPRRRAISGFGFAYDSVDGRADGATRRLRLGQFIRLLSSPHDGEVLAAVRALDRELSNCGEGEWPMVRDLVRVLNHPNGGGVVIAAREMGCVLADGGEDFHDLAERLGRQPGKPPPPPPAPPAPAGASWREVARWSHADADDDLNWDERARKFVRAMSMKADEPAELTEKQERWLRGIYAALRRRRRRARQREAEMT